MNNIAIVFYFENPVDFLNRFIHDFQIEISSVCEAHIQPHPLLWTIFDRTSWKQITTQRHENTLLHNVMKTNYYTTSWKQINTQRHESKLLHSVMKTNYYTASWKQITTQRHKNKLLHNVNKTNY